MALYKDQYGRWVDTLSGPPPQSAGPIPPPSAMPPPAVGPAIRAAGGVAPKIPWYKPSFDTGITKPGIGAGAKWLGRKLGVIGGMYTGSEVGAGAAEQMGVNPNYGRAVGVPVGGYLASKAMTMFPQTSAVIGAALGSYGAGRGISRALGTDDPTKQNFIGRTFYPENPNMVNNRIGPLGVDAIRKARTERGLPPSPRSWPQPPQPSTPPQATGPMGPPLPGESTKTISGEYTAYDPGKFYKPGDVNMAVATQTPYTASATYTPETKLALGRQKQDRIIQAQKENKDQAREYKRASDFAAIDKRYQDERVGKYEAALRKMGRIGTNPRPQTESQIARQKAELNRPETVAAKPPTASERRLAIAEDRLGMTKMNQALKEMKLNAQDFASKHTGSITEDLNQFGMKMVEPKQVSDWLSSIGSKEPLQNRFNYLNATGLLHPSTIYKHKDELFGAKTKEELDALTSKYKAEQDSNIAARTNA